MELRLQQFIASVEKLADLRNLDVFNPIIFQMEHPVLALRFTVVGSKTEPSYLGIPVNTTWIVLDPTSAYFRQAVKLSDEYNPDTTTSLPSPEGMPSLTWQVVRTYDEIFSDPQYYVANAGPRGPKGDKGDAGATPVLDLAALRPLLGYITGLTGTLEINGAASVGAGSQSPYTLKLTETELSPQGTPSQVVRDVIAPITLSGNVPAGVSVDATNKLHVGVLAANAVVTLNAVYPSWTKMAAATKDINLTKAAATGITVGGAAMTYAGSTSQLTATATFDDGTTSPVTASWVVDNTALATINATTGLLTGVNPIAATGNVVATATAVINGTTFTATKTISITKLAVTTLTINGAASVNVGATSSYTAAALLNSGASQTVVPTWTFANANASVTAAGVVTGAAAGTDTLTASYTLPGAAAASTATKVITVIAVVTPIYPFYGPGVALPSDWQAFVTALPFRGTAASVSANISFDVIGSNTYMYFAYPASYGKAQFFDIQSQFVGGWGGAGNSGEGTSAATNAAGGIDQPFSVTITVNGVATPFYVYRSDMANQGSAAINVWTVSPAL